MVTPPEPATNTDERTMLVQFLDFYRGVLEAKVDDLTDAEAREASAPPSDLTLLGLICHAAYFERFWFREMFHGEDIEPLFDFSGDPDADLHPGPQLSLPTALAMWGAEVAAARDIVNQAASLDATAAQERHGHYVNLRWILVHLIEEYARHCGHADILRQRLDGRTGDEPSSGQSEPGRRVRSSATAESWTWPGG
jgi:hypothetical protein